MNFGFLNNVNTCKSIKLNIRRPIASVNRNLIFFLSLLFWFYSGKSNLKFFPFKKRIQKNFPETIFFCK